MRLASKLLIFGYVSTMVAFAYAVPAHVVDMSWSDHARNHVLQALFWVEGFCLTGIFLVLFSLDKNERWGWWTTLVAGLFIYGGYFLAIPITGGGAPGLLDDIIFGTLSVVHIAGLALSWNDVNRT